MQAVIFDMDGLMFDTERLMIAAWDYAGEKAGLGKAGYMVYRTLGTNRQRTRQLWQEEFGQRYCEETIRHYTREYQHRYYAQYGVPVKPGLYALLSYLQEAGYPMAIASSSDREVVHRHLESAQVESYFSVVVTGDQVTQSKPEPDIFLAACRQLGLRPEACYVLEDSRAGLWAAYRAGCRPLMVPDLWQPDGETAAILAGKFSDLTQVIPYLEENR